VLRQLDLQRRLAGVGPAREDVEDQRAAVQHLDLERRLQPQLLRGRELLVEDHDRVAGLVARRADLLELAGADVGRGLGLAAALQRLPDYGRAGRARKPRQLTQRLARRHQGLLAVVEADEEGALLRGGGRVPAAGGDGAVGAAAVEASIFLPASTASWNGDLLGLRSYPTGRAVTRARRR
jgi:hypothetical protein